jgi:Zn-dependent M32 family carboxypeptidase
VEAGTAPALIWRFNLPGVGSKLEGLKKRLGEAYDLRYAASLLSWDEATYVPPGGEVARGRQLAYRHGSVKIALSARRGEETR